MAFRCGADGLSPWGVRVLAAGGTAANLVAAAVSAVLLRRLRGRSPATRFFFLVIMGMNLLEAGGYALTGGAFSFGDWGLFLADIASPSAWRAAIVAVGALLSVLGVVLVRRGIEPFLHGPKPVRERLARRMLWIPYIVGGVVDCLAATRNPGGARLVCRCPRPPRPRRQLAPFLDPFMVGPPRALAGERVVIGRSMVGSPSARSRSRSCSPCSPRGSGWRVESAGGRVSSCPPWAAGLSARAATPWRWAPSRPGRRFERAHRLGRGRHLQRSDGQQRLPRARDQRRARGSGASTTACSAVAQCGPSTCASSCCLGGVCQPYGMTDDQTCGKGGVTCQDCTTQGGSAFCNNEYCTR